MARKFLTGIETPQITLDGEDLAGLLAPVEVSATVPAAGWYRIARNGSVAVDAGDGDRAVGRFVIMDRTSGQHSSAVLYAGAHYGENSTLNLLHRSYYGGFGNISNARMVERGDYDGFALEIYAQVAGDISVTLYDDDQVSGWTLVNFEPGSVPDGFIATQLTLDSTIMAATSQGHHTAFRVANNGDTYIRGQQVYHEGNLPTSGSGGPLGAENDAVITADYTVTSGKNLVSGGPVEIADGVTVTVPDDSTWTVV